MCVNQGNGHVRLFGLMALSTVDDYLMPSIVDSIFFLFF